MSSNTHTGIGWISGSFEVLFPFLSNKMDISFYKGVKNGTPVKKITVDEFISGVKHGEWKKEAEFISSIADKNERNDVKRNQASCVTISGLFTYRKQDSIIKHSGFICIDFDDFDFEKYNDIKADCYTYASFRSVSGRGIAVIVRVDPEKHSESFDFLQRYYFDTYGCVIDPAPRNPASARFISYDTDTFTNPKSKKSKIYREPERKKSNTIAVVYGNSEVDELIRRAMHRGVNIAPDYISYRNLAFSLADGFGESGRNWFHTLCSVDAKYNSTQADKMYDSAVKGGGSRKIGIGTFYWMLKNEGVEFPRVDTSVQNAAMVAKKAKKPIEVTINQLVEVNGLAQDQATRLAQEVYKRDDIDLREMSKDPERLVESLQFYISTSFNIKKNEITGKYENNGVEMNEEDFNTIFLKCRSAFGSNSVTWDITNTIIRSNFTEKYNPIQDYIEKNYYRNSKGNIQSMIETINTDTPNAELFIRKWFLCIAAALDGKPVRSVLALVGGQNTGKTEWFRRLLPNELKKYYAESKLDAGKDDDMLMCQKLIVMDDEMGGKSKQDEKRFKELTSKQIFSLRAPYARFNEDFKRLAVLCGTSNNREVINDPTGNTRIFPVNVISLNHAKYNAINKDELFIEIIKLYESGENYELTRDELIELGLVSDRHTALSIEEEAINRFFRKPSEMPLMNSEFMSAFMIKTYIETYSTTKITNTNRFSQYLTKVFGESKVLRMDGKPIRCYEVVKLDFSKQNNNEEPIEGSNVESMPF